MQVRALGTGFLVWLALLSAQSRPAGIRHLEQLIQRDTDFRHAAEPESATLDGDHRFNDRWSDFSATAVSDRKAHNRRMVDELAAIDPKGFDDESALNLELLRRLYAFEVEADRFPNEYLLVDQIRGYHLNIPRVLAAMPQQTVNDYERILVRLSALPKTLQGWQAVLEEGMRKGITPPRAAIEAVPGQVLSQVSGGEPLKTPLLAPFAASPPTAPAKDAEPLRQRAIQVFTTEVRPAYEQFHEFLKTRYLPGARSTNAFNQLPDGDAWYALEVRRHTATAATPQQNHAKALKDIERIASEMRSQMKEVGFSGSIRDFRASLDGPEHHFQTIAEVLKAYRDIAKRIDPLLPRFFQRLPRMPFGIEAMPPFQAGGAPAYYEEPSRDGTRAGNFFVPSDPRANPKWRMLHLVLHEGAPGHHLERALALEQAEKPAFRQINVTAYMEGWATYAETVVGRSLGLETDAYERFGMLFDEMILATGIANDTGINCMGWSRERALELRRTYIGGPEERTVMSVNRMSVWPGQIMAYAVGGDVIRSLRDEIAQQLGPRFDVREFHDVVLRDGPLPLDVLQRRVRAHYSARR